MPTPTASQSLSAGSGKNTNTTNDSKKINGLALSVLPIGAADVAAPTRAANHCAVTQCRDSGKLNKVTAPKFPSSREAERRPSWDSSLATAIISMVPWLAMPESRSSRADRSTGRAVRCTDSGAATQPAPRQRPCLCR